MTTIIDADDMEKAYTTVRIQEYTADLYEGENDILLVWEDQDGYLFWMSGWMIDQATIEQIANSMTYYQKDGIDYAGLEDCRFHDLRHTFATLAIQNGVDIKTLSGILGHYSSGFTLDTYTHVTQGMKQDAADKMGRFMEMKL